YVDGERADEQRATKMSPSKLQHDGGQYSEPATQPGSLALAAGGEIDADGDLARDAPWNAGAGMAPIQ
ncbi:MAG: hypothetical protein JWL71_1141, partial [Acidobacteria bacterium]|nr:hypothetical protein [Acidobacteriota bacterium]